MMVVTAKDVEKLRADNIALTDALKECRNFLSDRQDEEDEGEDHLIIMCEKTLADHGSAAS